MLVATALARNTRKLHGGWQTAGVVFVADALGTWLVEQLADAGRKKLTELILGSEQERSLRRAADAAVWATAEEISPAGGEQVVQVARVISEVFRDPVPDAPLAGPVMLLEGLQARIASAMGRDNSMPCTAIPCALSLRATRPVPTANSTAGPPRASSASRPVIGPRIDGSNKAA